MALDDIETIIDRLQRKVDSLYASLSGGPSGGSSMNKSTSTTGGGGTTGGSLFDLGQTPDRTKQDQRAQIFGSALMGVGALSAMLPTTQEAMNLDAMANRMRFYGNRNAATMGGAFGLQNAMSQYGTPVNAIDASVAANMGAGVGLLPGLSNYGNGSTMSSFGGILGGATLASNLTPGMGLQGGMQAMGALNTARNVNMLRMIGVNVRGNTGQMNDLPDIIGQVYKLLEQSAGTGNVTPEAIAVSAMSGNALDSILNQYFGNDANLRQTVLSGLLQMANSKGASLKTSGTRTEAVRTGANTQTISTLSSRYFSEQKMLQAWTGLTTKAFSGANESISNFYGTLEKGTVESFGLPGVLKAGLLQAQGGITAIETLSGIRNNAGGALMQSATGLTSAVLSKIFPKLSNAPTAVAGINAAGILGAGVAMAGDVMGVNSNLSYGAPEKYSIPTATGSAPVYTGAITINVTAPAGSDAYDWASQIKTAMTNAARS